MLDKPEPSGAVMERTLSLRILLADDHDLVRDAIKAYVERLDPEAVVVTAASLEAAFLAMEAGPLYDVVLLDLNMPGMNGLRGLEEMISRYPDVPVCLLSGSVRRDDVMQALDMGAAGYIPKTLPAKALVNALRLVVSGETFIPSTILSGRDDGETTETAKELQALTAREREVLAYLAKGWANKEIARELDLQEVTIKLHIRGIFRKLAVKNRTQAARRAAELGL